MKPILFILLLLATSIISAQNRKAERLQIANEIENSIQHEMLNKWYPQNMDTLNGGFLTSYTYDFKPTRDQDKFIVTQARHTWSTSKASMRYPAVVYYKVLAQNGYRFLHDVMWDKKYGGFYTMVGRKGNVIDSTKNAYGNAFGIYALAAYCKLANDPDALSFAQEAFMWLEKHSHDPVHKGYYQHMQRNGTPMQRTATTPGTAETGYKDQNSSIHLLEAFTELYAVWPNDLLRERLSEMLLLIRDTMIGNKGYLTLFFQPDWTPVSIRDSSDEYIMAHHGLDYVSFGHNVETSYLLLEASHTLDIQNDTATLRIAKQMVDHALQNAWDSKTGGFYDAGYYFRNKTGLTIISKEKNWWSQAEAMNSLLLMSDLFPNDEMKYYDKFKQQWKYIQTYMIDHINGDWYANGTDIDPKIKTALKGHIWKGNYHQFRAMMNCVDRLRRKE
ncbi:MAG TPA: AGE family epimerase/isomerase [Chitinophagaceae bacterium]|nr:AGE family epimerase/isomerase [Chitinophagaceae bacterium]